MGSTGPRRAPTFRFVIAGVAAVFTLAGCARDAGVLDPPDEGGDPVDSAVVATIRLNGSRALLTVLGSITRLTVLARDSSGAVLCSVPAPGCASSPLNERFQWRMDVPGVVSLEEYDMGIYPNGGVNLTALTEGRVRVTASLDGVEATVVVEVVERARVTWSIEALASIRGIAVGEDGTIYAAAALGLQAVGEQGEVRWTLPTGCCIQDLPAIAGDGTIYLPTTDGLTAVGPDGTVLWAAPIDRAKSAPAIGPDGTIYLVSSVGTLYAVAPTGRISWTFAAPPGPLNRSLSPPAIAHDGTIYFGVESQHLYAIARDGSERWRFLTAGPVQSPSIGVDGTIYFANDRITVWNNGLTVLADSRMFALDPDGTERWSVPMEGDAWAAPAIGFDGSIYMGTINGGDIYVFAPDGSLLRKLGGGAGHTPIVSADGSIYRSLGDVTAVDGDGTLKWSFAPKNGASPAPAIGFDGRVYAGASDGADGPYLLRAFEELPGNNGGYHAAPWPTERGDRANTGRARRGP